MATFAVGLAASLATIATGQSAQPVLSPGPDAEPNAGLGAASPIDRPSTRTVRLFEPASDGGLAIDPTAAARAARLGTSFVTEPIVLEGDGAVRLRLAPFSVLDAEIDVRSGDGARADLEAAMRATTLLAGRIEGEPNSSAYVALSPNGATGFVDRGQGAGFFVLQGSEPVKGLARGTVRFVRGGGIDLPPVGLCGFDELDDGGIRGDGGVAGISPLAGTRIVELAIETDHEYLELFGGDEVAASEYVTALYGAGSFLIERDADTRLELTFVRLWPDAEDLFNEPNPLQPFRNHWNEFMTDVPRDLAQFLTGRRDLPYGGVAWLSAACGDLAYSVSGYTIGAFADPLATDPGNWDIVVSTHELGHNLGTLHTHNYDLDNCDGGQILRGSIMSYCHIVSGASSNIDLRFHRVTSQEMKNYTRFNPCLARDCNGNGVDDDLETFLGGSAADSNGDGIPDECQDCDGDGVLDPIAIAEGIVDDVDFNGVPDACEPDCNANGVPDAFDIALDDWLDLSGNGVLDECDPDCNGNGIADFNEIRADMTRDLDRDGVLDACQDCDGDGVIDREVLAGSASIWVGSLFDGRVRELDGRSGVQAGATDDFGAPVTDLAMAPDGSLLVASGDAVLRVDPATRERLADLVPPMFGAVDLTALRVDGGTVLVGDVDGRVRRFDASTGDLFGDAALIEGVPIEDVLVATDDAGGLLVLGGDSRVFRVVDGIATPIITKVSSGAPPEVTNFTAMIDHGDGEIVLASIASDALHRFDLETGAWLGRFDIGPNPGSSVALVAPLDLDVSSDGRAYLVASSGSDAAVGGYNRSIGTFERTYRIYAIDAPAPSAILVAPRSDLDCNANRIPDACDIADGTSLDENGDGTPDECDAPSIVGDLDGNGVVDGADLTALLAAWGTADGAADLDGDGVVGGADLTLLLANWG